MTTKDKALRLADELDGTVKTGYWEAAAELRRLHSVNADLLEALRGFDSAAQPAPVQEPVASLKEADVLMMAEAHGIDAATKGLYGFYIDCISNELPAQPAPVPTSSVEMVTENLVREGVNKHKARELAEHFYGSTPAAQPAPVQDKCWLCGERVESCTSTVCPKATRPAARRQWVGLTQEEIENCYGGEIDDFARAIEAKLKEKNT